MKTNLSLVFLLCFLAPVFFINFSIGEILIIGKLINYAPEKVTWRGVVGCPAESWMYPAIFFLSTMISLTIVAAAFFMSKKALEKSNTNLMLIGAFIFYPAAHSIFDSVADLFATNPLWFIDNKMQLTNRYVEVFGNMYLYHWTQFTISNLLTIVYLTLAYKIIFNYWNRRIRMQFFTVGLIASLLGNVFWYFLLGPIVYPK